MNDLAKTTANGKVTIPAGFRLLTPTEQINPGDYFTTPAMDTWTPTKVSKVIPGNNNRNPFSIKAYIRKQTTN